MLMNFSLPASRDARNERETLLRSMMQGLSPDQQDALQRQLVEGKRSLADIEREEAELRQRRQALQKKFHLRSV